MNVKLLVLFLLTVVIIMYIITTKVERYSQNTLTYVDFWSGFGGIDETIEYFAKQLESSRNLTFYSTFGNTPLKNNTINIQFSGESYCRDTTKFDLNLIHRKTDVENKIVFFPLFMSIVYKDKLLDKLKGRNRYGFPKKSKFCLFVVSNGNGKIRNDFFNNLNSVKKVDSCGSHLNNTGVYAPRDIESYLAFISQYKFMICFENLSQDYYLTEKLAYAYAGNTIPIYYGAPQVTHWFDMNSFFYISNQSDFKSTIDKILYLDQNHEKYMNMWQKPLFNTVPDELSLPKIVEKSKYVLGNSIK